MIRFDDIESIVIGLPPQLPWFFRIGVALGDRGCRSLLELRRTALLLRLRGERMLPLNLMNGQFRDGEALMEAFLKLNSSKVVGAESYSDAEIRRLSVAKLNRIVTATQ